MKIESPPKNLPGLNSINIIFCYLKVNMFISKNLEGLSRLDLAMKSAVILLGCFFLELVTGFSQRPPDRVITLQECLRLSVENSPRLKISTLEQDKLRYRYRETIGKGLPNINMSGSFDDYVSLPTQLIPGEFFGRPGDLIPVQF